MLTTTASHMHLSSHQEKRAGVDENELLDRYRSVNQDEFLPWTTNYRKLRKLGTGGQGVVYLAERCQSTSADWDS